MLIKILEFASKREVMAAAVAINFAILLFSLSSGIDDLAWLAIFNICSFGIGYYIKTGGKNE